MAPGRTPGTPKSQGIPGEVLYCVHMCILCWPSSLLVGDTLLIALQQAVNTCKRQSSSRHAGAWRMCLLRTAGISCRAGLTSPLYMQSCHHALPGACSNAGRLQVDAVWG